VLRQLISSVRMVDRRLVPWACPQQRSRWPRPISLLGSLHPLRALVPSFATQPLLQGVKMNLGILATKSSNVGLETGNRQLWITEKNL